MATRFVSGYFLVKLIHIQQPVRAGDPLHVRTILLATTADKASLLVRRCQTASHQNITATLQACVHWTT